MKTYKCHCGEEHTIEDPSIISILDKYDEFIPVHNQTDGRMYKVQRLYIAVHGITCINLRKLGFKEIKNEPTKR